MARKLGLTGIKTFASDPSSSQDKRGELQHPLASPSTKQIINDLSDIRSGRNSLENSGCAHSSTDAHRDHAVARVAPLEFAQDGRCKLGPGATERVAERERAAIWIYASGI